MKRYGRKGLAFASTPPSILLAEEGGIIHAMIANTRLAIETGRDSI
jgi:hypothetical protein